MLAVEQAVFLHEGVDLRLGGVAHASNDQVLVAGDAVSP